MTVRRARVEDAASVAAVWNHFIRDTAVTFNSREKTVDDVAGLIAARPLFLVAEVAGRVEGFATYAQFRGGVGYARTMEHSIQILPGGSGRGLGRALITGVEDHARACGAHSMIAGVSGENAEGRAFHARMGYAEVAVVPQAGWKFGRWMDLVLMQKFLD